MPRPRPRPRERIGSDLSEGIWKWLCGEWSAVEAHQAGDPDGFKIYLEYDRVDDPTGKGRALWERYRPAVIAAVAEAAPGTRPPLWWKFDAPEPRLRVSGRMIEYWSRSAAQSPSPWAYEHNGELGFWFTKPDPDNPPRLESEASYLKRLNLLLPGEERRLTKADFRPVLEYAMEEESNQ